MINKATEPSSYKQGCTMQQAADSMAADLLQQAHVGDLTSADHYGVERKRVEVYLVAGNGPHAEVLIVFDSEGKPEEAFLSYIEGSGYAATRLDDYAAERLYRAFRR